MRLREFSEEIPKPMVPIGYRPILWHLMRYYAHFGHNDFILCLGYRADAVASRIMGFHQDRIDHIRWARDRGLGTLSPEVLGDSVESVKRVFERAR